MPNTLQHLVPYEHLGMLSTQEPQQHDGRLFYISVITLDAAQARQMQAVVDTIVEQIARFDQHAKQNIGEAYQPTEKALKALKLTHLHVTLSGAFELLYDLPEGLAFEYVSACFSAEHVFEALGGGNY